MKTTEEIRDWLLKNAVNEIGDLNITGLDFSDFDGDIYIIDMKVQGNLYQNNHEVQGNLSQGYHEVKGNLYQSGHKVKGDYTCTNIKVKGNIYTNEPTKLLKEITTEELAEMGYKLKGE